MYLNCLATSTSGSPGVSNSMLAAISHCPFFSSCRTALIGVSPCPHSGMLAPTVGPVLAVLQVQVGDARVMLLDERRRHRRRWRCSDRCRGSPRCSSTPRRRQGTFLRRDLVGIAHVRVAVHADDHLVLLGERRDAPCRADLGRRGDRTNAETFGHGASRTRSSRRSWWRPCCRSEQADSTPASFHIFRTALHVLGDVDVRHFRCASCAAFTSASCSGVSGVPPRPPTPGPKFGSAGIRRGLRRGSTSARPRTVRPS